MNFSKIDNLQKKTTILIAPLDWGLGHASRCIPLIKILQELDVNVIIAAEKATKKILSEAFPSIQIIPLKGYRIIYSKHKKLFLFRLFLQFPKLILAINKEHQWLKMVAKEYKIDAIISDNRFGLYHSTLPSVYITHQLCIQTGNHLINKLIQKIHFFTIKKFSQCWVPDFENSDQNLAGALSHPKTMPANAHFIGCLSRFEKGSNTNKIFKILVILSGPEPQRSIFEQIILPQLQKVKGNVMLIRGLPEVMSNDLLMQTENVVVKNHLAHKELNKLIQQAGYVISRSGYTTVMDLVKLQQKAILVATPGQTEQEYLADYLQKKSIFLCLPQHQFNLSKAIEAAEKFPYHFPYVNMELYQQVVADFVKNLKSSQHYILESNGH